MDYIGMAIEHANRKQIHCSKNNAEVLESTSNSSTITVMLTETSTNRTVMATMNKYTNQWSFN